MTAPASTTLVVVQAYRFALDLTPSQERTAWSHVGGSRFAFNHLLALVKANLDQRAAERTYGIPDEDLTPPVGWSHYSLRKTWNIRKDEVAPWWSENSKEAYSDAAKRLSEALGAWSKSRKGTRAGKAAGFPRFKKRGSTGSVRFTTGAIRVEADRRHVTLPVLGTLKTHESTRKLARRLEAGTARILAATLSHQGGRWYASLTVEVERSISASREARRVVGVDVGLSTLYTIADPAGRVVEVANPRQTAASAALLRRASRQLSRKQGPDRSTGQRASNRYRRAQARVARIHAETAARRLDLIHKATTRLAKTQDVVVIEDLNVSGMVRNRHLAKAVSDAGFGEFARQLAYKTGWYGSTLVVADRWFPSSKTCSDCGAVKAKLLLSEREYACSACGTVIGRDVNAAVNLARLGTPSLATAGSGPAAGRGGPQKTSTGTPVEAAACETSTSPQVSAA